MEETRKPLTLEDLLNYIKTIRDDKPDIDFAPYRIFSAIIDNEDYDPDGFSQEIEDSEEDNVAACNELIKQGYDMIWGWKNPDIEAEYERLRNSGRWLENRAKKNDIRVDNNIIGICACQTHHLKVKKDGVLIKEETWRDYDSHIVRERLTKYFNDITDKGLKIYNII